MLKVPVNPVYELVDKTAIKNKQVIPVIRLYSVKVTPLSSRKKCFIF